MIVAVLNSTLHKVEAINQDLLKTRDALWGEMQLAKKIQTVLLPENPVIPGYKIYGYMEPAKEVGGDYYDVINGDENDWVIIGDVSGHGVPAGLIMMMVQASIRTVLCKNMNIKPSDLIDQLKISIIPNIQKMAHDKFMAINAISFKRNGVAVLSGRQQVIMIYRLKLNEVEIIQPVGSMISKLHLNSHSEDNEIEINVGDVILLFTDGVIEAIDNEGRMFTEQKLAEIFKKSIILDPDEIIQTIIAELETYTRTDDITLLVAKRITE